MGIFEPRIDKRRMAFVIAERFGIDADHIADVWAESGSESNLALVTIQLRYHMPIEDINEIFNQAAQRANPEQEQQ